MLTVSDETNFCFIKPHRAWQLFLHGSRGVSQHDTHRYLWPPEALTNDMMACKLNRGRPLPMLAGHELFLVAAVAFACSPDTLRMRVSEVLRNWQLPPSYISMNGNNVRIAGDFSALRRKI